jgi:cyclic pyranopterin phosphate synthase
MRYVSSVINDPMESNHTQLIDKYDRRLNYLRISLTDRCNLRCLYCVPREGIPKLRHEDILTYEEILRLARIAVNHGVDKIRLTGGEPLLRKGIYEFIPKLMALPGLKDISLTTNGVYLRESLGKIKSSGVKRINVSLDTLRPERYERITGYDGFHEVWEGIELARKLNFHPIKINAVVIRGLNDDELVDFAELSKHNPYHIRFIEYMPIGLAKQDGDLHHVPSSDIKEQLSRIGNLVPIPNSAHDGPAERFRFEGALGEIGFISPISHHFCHMCNRLRLTASGGLRPCLLSNLEEDLKTPLRTGASDSELARIFVDVSRNKLHGHRLPHDTSAPFPAHMSSIGG